MGIREGFAEKKEKMPNKPNPVNINIGKRISGRRGFLRMTQEHLARETNIPVVDIQNIESGRTQASMEQLFVLERVLKVAKGFFLRDVPIAKK